MMMTAAAVVMGASRSQGKAKAKGRKASLNPQQPALLMLPLLFTPLLCPFGNKHFRHFSLSNVSGVG